MHSLPWFHSQRALVPSTPTFHTPPSILWNLALQCQWGRVRKAGAVRLWKCLIFSESLVSHQWNPKMNPLHGRCDGQCMALKWKCLSTGIWPQQSFFLCHREVTSEERPKVIYSPRGGCGFCSLSVKVHKSCKESRFSVITFKDLWKLK